MSNMMTEISEQFETARTSPKYLYADEWTKLVRENFGDGTVYQGKVRGISFRAVRKRNRSSTFYRLYGEHRVGLFKKEWIHLEIHSEEEVKNLHDALRVKFANKVSKELQVKANATEEARYKKLDGFMRKWKSAEFE